MAKAYYTCASCGEKISIYGRNKAVAQSNADYAERHARICAKCYRAVCDAESAEYAVREHLPKLKGTEKQVAWANQIRKDYLTGTLKDTSPDYSEFALWIGRITDSCFFIDWRDTLFHYFLTERELDRAEAALPTLSEEDQEKLLMLIKSKTSTIRRQCPKIRERVDAMCEGRDLTLAAKLKVLGAASNIKKKTIRRASALLLI